MLSITPCRSTVTDRFPVASFVVHVPKQRVFEVACTTDPRLLRPEQRGQRTPENFFSSRASGLLRASAGQATWLLPSEQLRRFAGQRRLFYAVASFGDASGSSPEFTTGPQDAERAPFVSLSPDFTGRTLDRSLLRRASGPDQRYGAPGAALTWGGDRLAAAPAAAVAPQAPVAQAQAQAYDDGYPDDLWHPEAAAEASQDEPPLTAVSAQGEPDGYEDVPALLESEDAEAYGRRSYGGAGARKMARPASVQPWAVRPERAGSREQPRQASEARPSPHPAPARAEPPGAGDPDELRASYGSPQASAGFSSEEPKGFEDPRDLRGARYGDATPAAPSDFMAAQAFAPPGVDDAYDDLLGADPEGELPEGALGLAGALTILDKFRLAQPAAQFESGPDGYTAINADGEFNDPSHAAYQRKHYGLHWGFVQLNQRSGALGKALVACERRDPVKFREAFGAERDQLLRTLNAPDEEARLDPVGGQPLWQEPWITRFREAGRIPEFQAAQNEVAIEEYFDPNLGFAAALGLDSDRALAMVFDRCVDLGNAAGRRFVIDAVTPLRDEAAIARALQALGHDSPRSLQRSLGLAESDELGPKAHAALLQALRGLGASAKVQVPDLSQMLDALVTAAHGRRFESRVASLRDSSQLQDTRRQVS
jgi:hypothetical protein